MTNITILEMDQLLSTAMDITVPCTVGYKNSRNIQYLNSVKVIIYSFAMQKMTVHLTHKQGITIILKLQMAFNYNHFVTVSRKSAICHFG